jgi:hypothetical protein
MFLSMDYAAIAGINFVELGLRDWSRCRGGCVPSPEQSVLSLGGLILSLATPWRIRRADLRMARYGLADPVSQALGGNRRGLIKCPHGLRNALRQAGVLRSLLD